MTPPHVTKRATMRDVAELAGVSKATVSRVLNGSPLVTEETREKVQEAIRTSGYVVSYQARSLATGRTEAVALLVTEPLDDLWSDPTFAQLLSGVYAALSPTPLTPILLQATTREERAKVGAQLEQGIADGIIHLTPYLGAELLHLLQGLPFPVVLCGRLPGDPYHGRFSTVYADDEVGATHGAELIASTGRSQPVAILGPKENPAALDRLAGYRSVFGHVLSDDRVRFGPWDEFAGAAAIEDFLDGGTQFDAVLCGSDRIAAGVLKVLRRLKIRVPEDVSVIGFDDHPIAATTDPPLTTIAQPLKNEGMVAVELLGELLDSGSPRDVVMPMRMRHRASA